MTYPAKPIGWELASRYPGHYRDRGVPSSRGPCPLCGDPTGDCHEHREDEAMLEGPKRVGAAGARTVVVPERVVYDTNLATGAPTRKLKYHEGQVVDAEEYEAFMRGRPVESKEARGGTATKAKAGPAQRQR